MDLCQVFDQELDALEIETVQVRTTFFRCNFFQEDFASDARIVRLCVCVR
jgi:hypothetical protein